MAVRVLIRVAVIYIICMHWPWMYLLIGFDTVSELYMPKPPSDPISPNPHSDNNATAYPLLTAVDMMLDANVMFG